MIGGPWGGETEGKPPPFGGVLGDRKREGVPERGGNRRG